MKFHLTAILASVIFLCANVNAQTNPKLGHVNISKVLENHPDYKAAEKKLQDFAGQLQETLGKMEKEYTTKLQEYSQQEKDMLPAIKEVKAKEITDLETRILKLQSSSDQQLTQKQVELLKPLEEKVMTAIKGVAADKGFTYIFDSSTGSNLLHYPPSDDITALVKTKMGIQ
jgi:outer membrane protein